MGNQNTSPNYDFNFNIDDIIKIFESTGNVKSDSIMRIIENKDELTKLVNECKGLFSKEQLCKIEKGIEELSQLLLSKSQPQTQKFSNAQKPYCPPSPPCIPQVITPSTATTPPANFLMNEVNLYLVLFFLLAILVVPVISNRKY